MRPLVILALLLLACGCSSEQESACRAAGERPFELAEQECALRAASWKTFPEAHREAVMQVHAAWTTRLATSRRGYVGACVAACASSGARDVVSCRRSATSLSAWRRCDR